MKLGSTESPIRVARRAQILLSRANGQQRVVSLGETVGQDTSTVWRLCERYRRFGIESSYRCAGQVRGWTTSPNPAYRFLLIALSFVLLNVWVHLRWLLTQVPRRGHRWLVTQRFQLSRLVKFIRRALEHHYGYVHEIVATALPQP